MKKSSTNDGAHPYLIKPWINPVTIQKFIASYPTTTNKKLAARFDVTVSAVKNKAHELGLTKAAPYKNPGCYTKGQPAFNKGMKQEEFMTAEAIEKTKSTRFTKGHLPHNTGADGDISWRGEGYAWIRVSLGKWELYHRVLYATHHNVTLETADNIIFIDGNRKNFDINNLKKVRHEDLMESNTIHRYPPALKKTIKAAAKLTRTINNYEKQH